MKITLESKDFGAISDNVRKALEKLFPDNIYATKVDLLFGPEFLMTPLRVSTPKTHIQFDPVHKRLIRDLKKQISKAPPKERLEKRRQLESVMIFGQLLFSQSASLHFLTSAEILTKSNPGICSKLDKLRDLIDGEGVKLGSKFTKSEVLSRRKEFNDIISQLKPVINQSTSLKSIDKRQLTSYLSKSKKFYYQVNDLNFQYANKSSRNFSHFISKLEHIGSITSLGALIVAIGATALSFIPPLAPIMIPLATAATFIAVGVGLPVALKKVGNVIFNLFKYNTAPTKAELINITLLSTSMLLAGAGGVISHAVNANVLGKTASLIAKLVNVNLNLVKASLQVGGEAILMSKKDKAKLFKSELAAGRNNPEADEDNAPTPAS